ncbi:MAG TPA: asparagine synthase-related protein [Vicinamibacterales bacterium]|nr:asparagine synthase-related protein [Vicinamibacterales bacterium]
MGAVAAVLHFDGGSPACHAASRLLEAGPRAPGLELERASVSGASLARLRFVTTACDLPGQPVARGSLRLLFDGRLDNRDDLLRMLACEAAAADAALAAAAIERWDVGAFERLLGDFAIICWDTATRRAICARDPLGLRTLYFHHDARRLVCATDLAQVLRHPGVPARPDTTTALRFLAGDTVNDASTVYRDVQRVPPGCAVVADEGGVACRRYWSAEPKRTVRYRRDSDYADHCRELLVESVRCRLETRERAAVSLSGGVDSSSVAVTAALLVQDRPSPQPFSLVYEGRPEADEREYVAQVADRIGVGAVQVLPADVTISALARYATEWRDLPPTAADVMTVPLWQEMSRRGFRVALTGAGGDFVFSGTYFHYADLIRRGALMTVAREWRAARRETGGRHGLSALVRLGVWPALPVPLKRLLRPAVRPLWASRLSPARRPWLKQVPTPAAYPERPRGGSFAAEEIIRGLTSAFHSFVLESAARVAHECGVELRHPLLDVRLIEFLLAIPEEQRRKGPLRKYLLRRALDGLLPEGVAARTTKADFSYAELEAFERQASFFDALSVERLGWVDAEPLRQALRRVQRARDAAASLEGYDLPQLASVVGVELWLRTLEHDATV